MKNKKTILAVIVALIIGVSVGSYFIFSKSEAEIQHEKDMKMINSKTIYFKK